MGPGQARLPSGTPFEKWALGKQQQVSAVPVWKCAPWAAGWAPCSTRSHLLPERRPRRAAGFPCIRPPGRVPTRGPRWPLCVHPSLGRGCLPSRVPRDSIMFFSPASPTPRRGPAHASGLNDGQVFVLCKSRTPHIQMPAGHLHVDVLPAPHNAVGAPLGSQSPLLSPERLPLLPALSPKLPHQRGYSHVEAQDPSEST